MIFFKNNLYANYDKLFYDFKINDVSGNKLNLKDTLSQLYNLVWFCRRTKIPFEDFFPAEFDHRTSDSLMDSLTVDMVEKGVRELWNRCQEVA